MSDAPFAFSDCDPYDQDEDPSKVVRPAAPTSLEEELKSVFKLTPPAGPLVLATPPHSPRVKAEFDVALDVAKIRTARITEQRHVTFSVSAERPSRAIRTFRNHIGRYPFHCPSIQETQMVNLMCLLVNNCVPLPQTSSCA
jgi:hypothetical protein